MKGGGGVQQGLLYFKIDFRISGMWNMHAKATEARNIKIPRLRIKLNFDMQSGQNFFGETPQCYKIQIIIECRYGATDTLFSRQKC